LPRRQDGLPLADTALQICARLKDQGLDEVDLAMVRRTMAILSAAGNGDSGQMKKAQSATVLESIE